MINSSQFFQTFLETFFSWLCGNIPLQYHFANMMEMLLLNVMCLNIRKQVLTDK